MKLKPMNYGLHAFCVCTVGELDQVQPWLALGCTWAQGQLLCTPCSGRPEDEPKSQQIIPDLQCCLPNPELSQPLQSTKRRSWLAWKKPTSDRAETPESTSSCCLCYLQVRGHLYWSDGWGCAAHPQHQGRNKTSEDILHMGHFLAIRDLTGILQSYRDLANSELMSLTWEFLGREVNVFRESTWTSCFCHTSFNGKC